MIGLFDSGIGGLTVVREVMKALPDYSLVYLGDTARTPYGNKSPAVVSQYGLEAVKFLVGKGAQVIVVACNTVSAVGMDAIRQHYPKMPVFDVVTPAVEAVMRESRGHRVGVMGTRALVQSGIYQKLLAAKNKFEVVAQPAPLLVPLVEEGWLDRPETKRIVKRYLTPFKQAQVDTLVLACTHYPLLRSVIAARVGKRMKLIDPAEQTARVLADWLHAHPDIDKILPHGPSHFYATDVTAQAQGIAETWLRHTVTLEPAHIA